MTAAVVVVVVVVVLVPLLRSSDQGRDVSRAGHRLPVGSTAAGAEGAGAFPADPGRRPDGEGRPAHNHAAHSAAGRDHEGQRAREGECRCLLPDRAAEGRDRPDRGLHGRQLADRADDPTIGAGPASARRAALGARQDQRDPAGDHRRADRALGIKVSIVEIKDVEIPSNMQRAMAGRPRQSASDGRR